TCTKKVNNCSTYLADGTCNTCNSSYQLTDSKACKSPTKTYGGQTAYLVGDYYVYNEPTRYNAQGAADYCKSLGMRLPTLAETEEMYQHKGETGAPTRTRVWTSTKSSINCPTLRNFGDSYCVTGGGCVPSGGVDQQCSTTEPHNVTCVAKEE
ncbi:hypothetical protein IJ732_06550, partial [bacterium]|nr:hypothetical protein [bacterium]